MAGIIGTISVPADVGGVALGGTDAHPPGFEQCLVAQTVALEEATTAAAEVSNGRHPLKTVSAAGAPLSEASAQTLEDGEAPVSDAALLIQSLTSGSKPDTAAATPELASLGKVIALRSTASPQPQAATSPQTQTATSPQTQTATSPQTQTAMSPQTQTVISDAVAKTGSAVTAGALSRSVQGEVVVEQSSQVTPKPVQVLPEDSVGKALQVGKTSQGVASQADIGATSVAVPSDVSTVANPDPVQESSIERSTQRAPHTPPVQSSGTPSVDAPSQARDMVAAPKVNRVSEFQASQLETTPVRAVSSTNQSPPQSTHGMVQPVEPTSQTLLSTKVTADAHLGQSTTSSGSTMAEVTAPTLTSTVSKQEAKNPTKTTIPSEVTTEGRQSASAAVGVPPELTTPKVGGTKAVTSVQSPATQDVSMMAQSVAASTSASTAAVEAAASVAPSKSSTPAQTLADARLDVDGAQNAKSSLPNVATQVSESATVESKATRSTSTDLPSVSEKKGLDSTSPRAGHSAVRADKPSETSSQSSERPSLNAASRIKGAERSAGTSTTVEIKESATPAKSAAAHHASQVIQEASRLVKPGQQESRRSRTSPERDRAGLTANQKVQVLGQALRAEVVDAEVAKGPRELSIADARIRQSHQGKSRRTFSPSFRAAPPTQSSIVNSSLEGVQIESASTAKLESSEARANQPSTTQSPFRMRWGESSSETRSTNVISFPTKVVDDAVKSTSATMVGESKVQGGSTETTSTLRSSTESEGRSASGDHGQQSGRGSQDQDRTADRRTPSSSSQSVSPETSGYEAAEGSQDVSEDVEEIGLRNRGDSKSSGLGTKQSDRTFAGRTFKTSAQAQAQATMRQDLLHRLSAAELPDHVSSLVFKNQESARLQLHPAELGKMQLELQVKAGEVQLKVAVENAVAAAEVQSQLGQLKEQLQLQGLKLGDVSVDVSDKESNTEHQLEGDGADERDGRARDERETNRNEEREQRASGRRKKKSADGRLDVIA